MPTDPEEFKKFHELLTADSPDGYEPFYFPLEKNGKDPQKGKSWKQNRKTFREAYNLLHRGFNIGIAATENDPLVIVDIDDLSQVRSYKPTLENQSRKRLGRHCFYFTSDVPAKSIFDNSAKQNIATEDAGELRANWQYVVAAGSYVPCAPEEIAAIPEEDRPNAGKYTVMVERSVTSVTYTELPDAYRVCLENKRAVDIANRQKRERKPVSQDRDGKNKSAIWTLTIYDVTGKTDNPSKRFPSPFHGSHTEANTSVSNGMLHCWRHSVSHTAITYIAVESGLSTCSSAGFGHNGSGLSDVDTRDPKTVYTLWLHAKTHGYISDSDPMPTKAMVYYALQEGLCDEKDVIDGWKLPRDVYNKIIETAPFNVGREPLKKKTEKIGQAIQGAMLNPMQIAVSLQEHIPIYFDPARNYWMWNDDLKKYDRVDETEIMCQISTNMDLTIYRSKIKQEILEAIRITGRMRRVQPAKKEWIQFENVVVNVETGETFEATPDYFFAAPIPHRLGDSEETPTIDGLFKSWQNEKAALLYEICAYCLYDGYPIQRIFAFVGSGSNGKGQFMTLLRRLIGADNCVGTDLDRLAQSRFEASKLYNKKVAFIGETNYNTISRTNILKQLSGGDLVSGEFKGRDPFDFINTAKIVIATNGLPMTTDRSEGFYRRWCTAEFKNKFKDGKDVVDSVPESEYANLCRKSIRILKEILSEGKLPHEDELEKRKDKYEALSNPVQAFIDDECEVTLDAFVPTWYLYEQYDAYREKRGHRKITKDEFAKTLRGMGFETEQKWYNSVMQQKYSNSNLSNESKNWRTFVGIGLKSSTSNTSNSKVTLFSPIGDLILFDDRDARDARKNNIAPLQFLDRLILQEVHERHDFIEDIDRFVGDFCSKHLYFRASAVKPRVVMLKTRGWKT